MADKGDPAYWHCQMHEGFLNGVQARWADTAQNEEEKARVKGALATMWTWLEKDARERMG